MFKGDQFILVAQWRRASAVAMDGERGSGAALRRRERRLRAWQRHVRMAVQLALAETLHHSANKVEPHDALRGQEKRAGREVEEHESHAGLRAQTAPPPGMRPEQLPETPGPQRSDRSLRRSSGDGPLLVVASLAAATDDGVDAATLSFLTARALEDMRKDEEERKKKKEEAKFEEKKLEYEARERAATLELDTLLLVLFERQTDKEMARVSCLSRARVALLNASFKRKRKKRRKRRTRRTTASRTMARCVPFRCLGVD